MTSILKRVYGSQDLKLGELRNFRVHIYATLAALNADTAASEGRLAYVTETGSHYFGKSGSWQVNTGSSFASAVANLAALPASDVDGTVRVVLDDGTGIPSMHIYDAGNTMWKAIGETTGILADGSVPFTGIPSVTNPATVVPTAAANLTTKKYVDDQDAAHVAASDPHAQYTTNTEATTIANAAISTHVAASDPHSQYTTNSEAITIADQEAANSTLFHDFDPDAHGGVATITARSGQTVREMVTVVNGAHGSPFVADPYSKIYKLAVATRPIGVIWRPSTKTSLGSASVIFTASGSNIEVSNTAGFITGDVLGFPSAVTNAGVYFTITDVVDGTNVTVTPTPINETVSTVTDRYSPDGVILTDGRFEIDNAATVFTSVNVESITVSNDSGLGEIFLAADPKFNDIRVKDSITLTGTTHNGTYTVGKVNYIPNSVVLTVGLGGSDQVSPAGTAGVTHAAQSHNFNASYSSGAVQTEFYTDASDAKGYSTKRGTYLLGLQVNPAEVNLQIAKPAGIILRGTTTSATPAEIFIEGGSVQLVLLNNTELAFAITVTARRTDVAGDIAVYGIRGAIKRGANAASTAIIGTTTLTNQYESDATWDVSATADTSSGALAITVTGASGKTINWEASANLDSAPV